MHYDDVTLITGLARDLQWLPRTTRYCIGGIIRGEKFCEFSVLEKIIHKTKNLYGSHLIFDQFTKI